MTAPITEPTATAGAPSPARRRDEARRRADGVTAEAVAFPAAGIPWQASCTGRGTARRPCPVSS